MEHTSDIVYEGRLIGDSSYDDRSRKFTEVEIDGVKIDFYDGKNRVIHEVKKSAKMEDAHIAQVKYYIYKLLAKGIDGVTGLIEYPKLKKKLTVELSGDDVSVVEQWEKDVRTIADQEVCPPLATFKVCKNCSYHDFCHAGE